MTAVFAVLNEQHMAGVVLWCNQHRIELMVGLGDIATGHPPQTICHSTYMCVDCTYRGTHGKHEHTGGGFDANAVLCGEPCQCIVGRHLLQEIEGIPTSVLMCSSQGVLDAFSFGGSQPSDTDGLFEFVAVSMGYVIPIEVAIAQAGICRTAVAIGGVLRQDGHDQLINGGGARLPHGEAVVLTQSMEYGFDLCLLHHTSTIIHIHTRKEE